MRLTTSTIRLAGLGFGTIQKMLIALTYIYLYIKRRMVFLPSYSFKIKFLLLGRVRTLSISDISDYWAIKDVFLDLEYDYSFNLNPGKLNIIDLGGNIGISALFFSLKYPNSSIFVFEPNPNVLSDLNFNLKSIDNVSIFPVAISNSSESTKFHISKDRMRSSMVVAGDETVNVQCIAPTDILSLCNIDRIDILKFDIEGSEVLILNSFLNMVSNVVGEIHYDLINMSNADVSRVFADFKFFEKMVVENKRSIVYAVKK